MSIRRPFARSASLGGGASIPLPTGTPTLSSSYSSDGTQSTNQQNTQSSTSSASSSTSSGETPSASISTPFSSLPQSDGTSTNYKGSEPSADMFLSTPPSSSSSMSTGGEAPTNIPPSGGGITTLPLPVSTGGTTFQTNPATFGPASSGPATSVSSDAPSPSPLSQESGPTSGDLPSITLPSSLPSPIFTSLPLTVPTSSPSPILTSPSFTIPTSPPSPILTSLSFTIPTSSPSLILTSPSLTTPTSSSSPILTSPSLTIPTSPPSSILASVLSSIFTSPPIAIPTSPPSSILDSLLSSILTSPPLNIPTSLPSSTLNSLLSTLFTSLPSAVPTSLPPPPTQKPPAPLTTSQSSTHAGQETSSQASSSTTSIIVGNPPTTSSTPSSSADGPSTTSDTNLSTPLPGKQTSSQQSTSPTTSTTSDATTAGKQTSSQQSTSPTTSITSGTIPAGNLTSSQQSTSPTTSITSDTIPAGKQTSSQQSTSLLTSPTSTLIPGDPATSPAPTDSTHSSETIATGITKSTSSLTTDSHADTYTTPQSSQTGSFDSPTPTLPSMFSGGSSATVSATQSFYTPQSPGGSSVNTPISTGNVFTVSSIGLPTPFSGSVGNPFPNTFHPTPSAVADNAMGTTSPIPPSGDTFSSTTITSIGTSTITTYSHSGSNIVPVTLTSTSTFLIPTTIAVPTSRARPNEAPIIGGIVGGVLALLLVCIAACYLVRRRRRSRAHQQLHDSDLTAPLSPAGVTTMRENHPYIPTYSSVVGGQGASDGRGDLHYAANSFGSSAFPHPSIPGSPHGFSRGSSVSVLHENFDMEMNDGDISSDDGSECTERYFTGAQSFHTSNDGQSSLSGGIGIAIGSQSSMDIHSYHTAATMLATGTHTMVDNDEECDSPGPSPSAFPAPPVNPFLDGARVTNLSDFVASRASQNRPEVSVPSEDAALAPAKIRRFSEQQASWAAAVAAASPVDHDAPTPIATRSLNALIGDEYDDDPFSQDAQTPTQSRPPVAPFNDSSFIVNPFLHETSQEGFSDDSEDSHSHETVSIMYPYPFESGDKGKGKEYLSADLGDDPKNNRLSNASSGLVFPDNPSQCGLAL